MKKTVTIQYMKTSFTFVLIFRFDEKKSIESTLLHSTYEHTLIQRKVKHFF